jgi:inner membrane protein
MMGITHTTFGLLCSASAFSLASVSLHKDLPAMGCTLIGSLLPDIDSPRSSLGRLLPFISAPIERRWGHRTVTHCLLALGGLGLLLSPLAFLRPGCYVGLLIGYLSHLLADCATKSGVPLLHPYPGLCVMPGNERYRVLTGSLQEGVLLAVLLLLLALVFPLSKAGGVWKALRYLMATQSAAYQDFRQQSGEVVLEFKGRWRESRQPVEGEALILEGSTTRFLIAFQGQVWVYGEQGDILPDRSRIQATGHPLQVDTLRVKAQPFARILEQLPDSGFVSGRLECAVDFEREGEWTPTQHAAIKATSRTLDLEYAPRALLARLHPHRPPDPQRLEALQSRITDQQRALMTLELRRPPVHYLELREAQSRLEVTKRELEALQDPTVLFAGVLYVRRGGAQ